MQACRAEEEEEDMVPPPLPLFLWLQVMSFALKHTVKYAQQNFYTLRKKRAAAGINTHTHTVSESAKTVRSTEKFKSGGEVELNVAVFT